MNFNRSPITNLVFALIAIFLFSSGATAGGILFVDDDASPDGDGTSWNTAYRFLQDALATADGGGISEIHIAQGTYKPDQDEVNPNGTGDRHAWFKPSSGLRLLGGFAGIGAENPDLRDVKKFETILSGDLLGNDGPEFLNNDENSFHIFFLPQDSGSPNEIDGFTITSANANSGASHGRGAGILMQSSSPMIRSCTFKDNFAYNEGAGIYISNNPEFNDDDPMIIDCLFENNSATIGSGAAVFIDMGRPLFIGCEFISNEASQAGAVNIQGNSQNDELRSGGIFQDCLFQENSRSAIRLRTAYCEINNCFFYANSLSSTISITKGSEVFITSSVFLENISLNPSGVGSGGAIYSGPSKFDPNLLVLSQCAFISNLAGSTGGAMSLNNTFTTIERCLFIGNSAGEEGGAIRNLAATNIQNSLFVNNSSAIGGAIMNCCNGGVITITNSTIVNNSASESGGGINNGLNDFSQGEAIIQNCVLWGNIDKGKSIEGAQIHNGDKATWTIDYSCIQGLTGNLGGTGNIGSDPLFLDPSDDNFRLSLDSPCIDAGDNSAVPQDEFDLDEDGDTDEAIPFDLDGNSRFVDNPGTKDTGSGTPPMVDMGAYEFSSDCNNNGVMDLIDIDKGTSEDCNGNSIPDECEIMPPFFIESGQLGPIGLNSPQIFIVNSPPTAYGDAIFSFTAIADLQSVIEFIDVEINGIAIGSIFVEGAQDCPKTPDMDEIIMPVAGYNEAMAGGDVIITLTATDTVSPVACNGENYITVALQYSLGGTSYDLNDNGIPDECETPGDLNGDGVIGTADLLMLLSSWGLCGDCDNCVADLDGDCNVGTSDLLILLSNWG